MSNFMCDKCGTAIIDSPKGYITSCEHHKAEDINKFLSRHLEGDCHCHGSIICNPCLNNLVVDTNEIVSTANIGINDSCKEKYGKPLNDVFDARIWAEEFIITVKEHPDIPLDIDSMTGWFANAIMAGYDEAYRRYKDKV